MTRVLGVALILAIVLGMPILCLATTGSEDLTIATLIFGLVLGFIGLFMVTE